MMASLPFDSQVYNGEVAFCKVYSLADKEKLEKALLKNRISYFIDWQERSFLSRLFGSEKHKNIFIIRINEADVERAKDIIGEMASVKLTKIKEEQ